MKKPAFTLIETLIAITLMTVVITAVTGLILTTLLANSRNRHSLQATLLAEEGLEVLRYMRDSNWLQNYSWDGGSALWGEDFVAGPSGKTVYVKSTTCTAVFSEHPCFELSADPDDGSITLDDGAVYNRALVLEAVKDDDGSSSADKTELTAIVTWEERGEEKSVQVSTYLTNWK